VGKEQEHGHQRHWKINYTRLSLPGPLFYVANNDEQARHVAKLPLPPQGELACAAVACSLLCPRLMHI
jgi:hypothetical protein